MSSSRSSRARRRSRRRPRMRWASVPVRPATGSDESSSRRTSRSFHIVVRSEASASGVIRSSSERPEPSTSRTPVDRHAGLREQPGDDADAGRRRPAVGLHRAELLQQHLGRRSCRSRGPSSGRSRESGGESTAAIGIAASSAVAVRRAARDPHARAHERAAEELRGGERGIARGVAADAAAVDDQRRERRRLLDVERRLPAGRGAARVEPRLVAEHASRSRARSPLARTWRASSGQIGGRERRVAVALEHEVALPGRCRPAGRAEDVGLDREGRAERGQRGVGDGELLVRRGQERQRRVARVDRRACVEVERDRAGRGRG